MKWWRLLAFSPLLADAVMDDTHQLSLTLAPAPEAIMTVRPGTLDDPDVRVNLGLAAMSMDPQWDYRYPHRDAYPQEHRECTGQRWERFFHPDPSGGEWAVYLVDYLPKDRDADSNNNNNNSPETETERETDKETDTGRELEPVTISFSVWHFPPHLHDNLRHEQRNEQFGIYTYRLCPPSPAHFFTNTSSSLSLDRKPCLQEPP